MTNTLLAADKPSDTPPPPAPPQEKPPASGGTATKTRPTPTRPAVEFLPLFQVLLHNDDVNSSDFIVSSIVELTPLNNDRARQVMLEAHTTGVGLLLVTHKERAELYQDQFKSKMVTVTIEPVE